MRGSHSRQGSAQFRRRPCPAALTTAGNSTLTASAALAGSPQKLIILGSTTSASLWLSGALNDLRQEIGSRIRQHLQGSHRRLCRSHDHRRARLPSPRMSTKACKYRGLHIYFQFPDYICHLAAGGVFWIVRAFLALFPTIAQRWPIKKWAAGAALVFGFAYMLLAGSGAATQRSYIMLAVVFLAIIVDRPAISLRNLALAALLILILQPESAIQASFQMSFMAVMGLAAFFEYWNRPRPEREYRIESRKIYYARKFYNIALASILTTLIAGSFSSIPAAYHFGRLGALRRSGQWLGHSRDQSRRDALCRAERCADAPGSGRRGRSPFSVRDWKW